MSAVMGNGFPIKEEFTVSYGIPQRIVVEDSTNTSHHIRTSDRNTAHMTKWLSRVHDILHESGCERYIAN